MRRESRYPSPARGVRCVVVLLAAALIPRASSGAESPNWGRAYYLFSLAQQAQFDNQLTEAAQYLEEAIHTADSSDLRVELAELYSTMNKPAEAEAEAREALKMDPSSFPARKTLAQILFQRAASGEEPEARLKESESLFQDLLEKDQAEEGSVLNLADLRRGRGDLAGAAAALEKFKAAHPSSSPVAVQLARIYLEMGRSAEAGKVLREVLEKAGDNRDARELLADILEEAGEAKEAVEIYRPAVEASPGNPYGQYRLGTLLNSAGRFEEAQEHLRSALQVDPANLRVLMALGQAYLGSGDNRQAEDLYQQALDRDAGSLEARFFLGRIAQARAEDERALTLYDQILTQASEQKSPQEKVFFGLASFQIGVIHYLRKDYAAAAKSVQDALQASSRPSDEVYGLLVRIHLDARKMPEAATVLQEGRSQLPDSMDLQALEGEILLREGKRAAARKAFRQLEQKSQGSVPAYLAILQACARAESNKEGAIWAREARGKHADSEELAFQLAALQERSGRFKASEKAFRTLLERHPDNAEALNYLGYMLADRGIKLEEALGMIQKAVSLQPNNAAFQDSLGWVYYRLGRVEQAEDLLARAAAGSREDPTVLEHLGDVRMKLGKPVEAQQAYLKALERAPEDPEAIRKKLRKLGGPRTLP